MNSAEELFLLSNRRFGMTFVGPVLPVLAKLFICCDLVSIIVLLSSDLSDLHLFEYSLSLVCAHIHRIGVEELLAGAECCGVVVWCCGVWC